MPHSTKEITCPTCKGSGDDLLESWRVCQYCLGNRTVRVTLVPVPREPPAAVDEPPGKDI